MTRRGRKSQLEAARHVEVPQQLEPPLHLEPPAPLNAPSLQATRPQQETPLEPGTRRDGPHAVSATQLELQQLREQLDELRRLNRLKDQCLSMAAHELATPLTAIRAYIEALAENYGEPDFTQGPEFLKVLQRETERLIRVVDRTLQLSRLTSRSQLMHRVRLDLRQLVEEVADSMRPVLSERAVTLEVQVPEGLAPVDADRDLLEQVLINLVDNAMKFSPRGSTVLLRVSLLPHSVEIEVRDHGYGIAAQELSRIFDPYFRSSDGRIGSERGIGLGLAIVKTIVEQHDGHVFVTSEVDRGTSFRFALPQT